jgi:hypothetical protein
MRRLMGGAVTAVALAGLLVKLAVLFDCTYFWWAIECWLAN